MAAQKSLVDKRYFTVSEANAMLPLVRAILRDISELAADLRERQERLSRLQPPPKGAMSAAHREELQLAQEEFERDQERLVEYERELRNLGIELKGYSPGLIDFPCWLDNREVCLCWQMGEPEVGYWHEVDAGFRGRQKLKVGATRS
jgi:hypothetical protein